MSALWALSRPFFFLLDAEKAHQLALSMLPVVGLLARGLGLRPDPSLRCTVAGLAWGGPVGLAAGLDKEGVGVRAWEALGFGAIEVGTVTAQAQPGNPKPRMFRLVEERALINRMGFNNHGAVALAARLSRLKQAGGWPSVPVGANLGKTKIVPNEQAVEDYLHSLRVLQGKADYYVVNVSSPNTPNLRALQERDQLQRLLGAVVPAAGGLPVFLKLAPDLTKEAIDEAVEVAVDCGCAGIIATNTTLQRPGDTGRLNEAGGLSGAPLQPIAREALMHVLAAARGRVPVIGVGGIATVEDVIDCLKLGCAAVQVYSAMVYEGPALAARLHRELAEKARAAGGLERLVGRPQP